MVAVGVRKKLDLQASMRGGSGGHTIFDDPSFAKSYKGVREGEGEVFGKAV